MSSISANQRVSKRSLTLNKSFLLSVFLFGAIFGIWGVFFAVPLASFIKSLMDNWKYADS